MEPGVFTMEAQPATTLVSFNKEIQDGSTGTAAGTSTTLETAEEESQPHTTAAETAYFVAESNEGATVEGYQYGQSDGQYGTTYYASSDGTYNAAATTDQGQQDTIAAYTAEGATVMAVATTEDGGLQQIVLSVSDVVSASGDSSVKGKRSELVAIPAAFTTQSMSLQTEQPTFAAMQPMPPTDTLDYSQNGQQMSDGATHIRMVLRQSDGTEIEQTIPISATGIPTIMTSDGQEIEISDEGTLQMMASLAEQAASGSLGDGNNKVLLNMGNSYQTVTVVPTECGGQGEMMLIVSQPDDKDSSIDLDLDMSVDDYHEGEQQDDEVVSKKLAPDGTKTRTIRITQKKSQIATQAHTCDYCNYTSPKRSLLTRHMKSHSEERPHKCGLCERGFKNLVALQNHVNTHTGTKPYCCKDCDSCFTTNGELIRHVRYRHTHKKPHRCTECDYASVELSKLKRHMRSHTGERPYQCPQCTYASTDMFKLKRHLRIHTGEKPYECDICQARFTQWNTLKSHKLIHSGNKPSRCDKKHCAERVFTTTSQKKKPNKKNKPSS